MRNFWQDVRYGLRVLGKSSGFAAIAILTLALGIGANTALFSVVNGVLLNPLPYPHSEQLVALYTTDANFSQGSIAYPNFQDWLKENKSFAALGASRSDNYNLTGAGEPERVHAHMISAEFFTALEAPMALGRNFRPEEDQAGAAPVAILGDGLWKRKFGGSPEVLGRTLNLGSKAYTVVGVGPSRVAGFSLTDVYTPVGQWTDATFRDRRVSMGLNAIGRLKPGVSMEQARQDMERISRNLAAAYPEANTGRSVALVPMKQDVVGDVRGVLLVLLGAVGFVLLIACANVANLLLARSTGRTREFAIRAALGAGPARIIRQLLTESVMLGVAGGALGLLIAKWGTRAILAALPDALPRAEEIGIDSHVLVFTVGVSVLTGILFGLFPAIKTLRPDMHETLKEGGRGGSGARHRAQGIFVALEMAMALVLLIGAGLMIRSLAALWGLNPGFDARHVLTYSVSLTSSPEVTADQLRAKYRASLREFENVPGVEHVSMIGGSLPMTGDSEIPFWIEGQPKPANWSEAPFALFYLVTPGYQPAMRIPLERGRFLNAADDEHSPSVAVIDASFARKYFPGQDPIGKRVNLGLMEMQPEIVGVMAHVEHWGLGSRGHEQVEPQIYMPVWQVPDRFWPLLANGSGWVARTTGAPGGIAGGVREAQGRVDSTAVIYEVRPMEEIVANSITKQRLTMMLLSVFSALALALSAVGIYGVISYLTGQRTHEIGIRVALGASAADVLRMILGEGMRITLIGVGIGIVAALGLTRLITKIIYGISASDPLTFFGVAVLLTAVALLACYIPARRAMRVDPIIALRYE